jgi:hypothetical protein
MYALLFAKKTIDEETMLLFLIELTTRRCQEITLDQYLTKVIVYPTQFSDIRIYVYIY